MTATQTATAQRLKQAKGRLDKPQKDFLAQRDFHRVVPAFELMERRGHITRDERIAGESYAGYWHGARRERGLVGAYGEERWSGTSGSMITEEWPIHCAQELQKAKEAIGDRLMVEVLERVVEADATLQDVGKVVFPATKSASQSMSEGKTALKFALRRLVQYYGFRTRDRP